MFAMLREMTATEFAYWSAFYSLEPWGCDVDDHRAGVIGATVANTAGKSLKKGKTVQPADLFPPRYRAPVKKEARPLDDAQVDAVFSKLRVIDVPPPRKG